MSLPFWRAVHQKNIKLGAAAIFDILKNNRYLVQTEDSIKAEVAKSLNKSKIPYRRNVQLTADKTANFLIDTIAIQINFEGTEKEVLTDLHTFCDMDKVQALILITDKEVNVSDQINHKPVKCFRIFRTAAYAF